MPIDLTGKNKLSYQAIRGERVKQMYLYQYISAYEELMEDMRQDVEETIKKIEEEAKQGKE